jgi:acetyl-CoA carboxylase beta subunit
MEQNVPRCGVISNRHEWKYLTSAHRVCSKCGDMQVLKSDNLNTYFHDTDDFEAFVQSIMQHKELQKRHAIAVKEGRKRALAWLKRSQLESAKV